MFQKLKSFWAHNLFRLLELNKQSESLDQETSKEIDSGQSLKLSHFIILQKYLYVK